jgi:SAM-dependent methyltransferase
MKSREKGHDYNERLFSGGLRSKLHLARFHWVSDQIKRLGCPADAVLEIGCFDGKLLQYLEHPPARYAGFDANWENGLDLARERWGDRPGWTFTEAEDAEALGLDGEVFDVAVVMETLEHLTPETVDGYLRAIAAHLDGYLFVTVPNEKGLVFLSKYTTKKLLGGGTERYSFGDLVNATLGRMHKIDRTKHAGEHKGFDYRWLIGEIGKYFDVQQVQGLPMGSLPPAMNYGVAILAKSKSRPNGAARPT